MKKDFKKPLIQVIVLENDEIISTSGGGGSVDPRLPGHTEETEEL